MFTCPNCGRAFPAVTSKHLKGGFLCHCGQSSRGDFASVTGTLNHARPIPRGPGTELTALFAEIDVREKTGCNCQAIAAEMDRVGIAGCRERRDYFLGRLRENEKLYTQWERAKVAPKALVMGIVSLGGFFDEAIRRAEAKASGGETRLAMIGPVALPPAWRHRFPTGDLLLADHCLNPSIIAHAGRTYMAYRRGWGQARIVLAELDGRSILWQRELKLPLRGAADLAHEDPRLFVFRGELHVAYTGVTKVDRVTVASVCYSRLSESGDVLADFQPHYAGRASQEKNWSFFDAGDGLHAIYWHGGQRQILRIDGDKATLAHDYQQQLPFAGGEPRGGASPIYHDGEWYSFFHGVAGEGTDRIYSAGLYTFDPDPPFRIVRHIRQPLLLPNLSERPTPKVPHCVYPAGAVLHDGQWILSLGYYDHWCELAAFDAAAIERLLV